MMITTDLLKEAGFFDKKDEINTLALSLGIEGVFITKPILSDDYLHIMLITNSEKDFDVEKLLVFKSKIEAIGNGDLKFNIFEKEGADEAIQEGSVFSEEYEAAFETAIPLEELREDEDLAFQWDKKRNPMIFSKDAKDINQKNIPFLKRVPSDVQQNPGEENLGQATSKRRLNPPLR